MAIHEIGHAVGMMHSKNKESVMHPIFETKMLRRTLHEEDHMAVISLYENVKTDGRELHSSFMMYMNYVSYTKLFNCLIILKYFVGCLVGSITDIPGKPNSKNGPCTGKCLEETNQSLNDRG